MIFQRSLPMATLSMMTMMLSIGLLRYTPQVFAELRVSPASVRLDQPEATQQLLVTQIMDNQPRDVTREVEYKLSAPAIARVDGRGVVHPLAEGTAQLVIRHGQEETVVPLAVSGIRQPVPVSFAQDIIPILTKARCNSGGCHGKAEGQNGFKLSLFGFGASSDYEAIVKEAKGRRLSLAEPERSLLLLKATAQLPHGGGLKIEHDSYEYRRVRRWIAAGAHFSVPNEKPILSIEVEPAKLILSVGKKQQLRVTAVDAEGGRYCATSEADYACNASHIAVVDDRGLLEASDTLGEAAVLVRYLGHVTVCRVTIPRPDTKFERPSETNFVDKLVWDKLTQLGIQPSETIDDATFLRRVYLDTIGTLPTAEEARRFLANSNGSKRAELVNDLLGRPEHADFWCMKWSDLLRVDKIKITPQGAVGLTRWLRRQFAENRPYDQMVREILTAQGPIQSESPAAFFKSLDQPELASRSISQLFLGVRIECAQCHHHPSERWSQDDYAGLAGFFTGLAVKRLPDGTESVISRVGTDQKHPRTGELVPARALGAPPADFSAEIDRRRVLADWVTSHDNPFFARAIVNRLWAHYFGRGLVEPIDDQRITNPATNEPLIDGLAQHLKDVRYDLRAFTRTLLNSQVYQLSSVANKSNAADRQHGSHATPKALPAEVLLDAICQTTGVPEKFNGWPLGVRSIQVWDNRMPSYFFRIFGRPARATVCECERSNEPSISQALHLLNSPEVNAKISDRNGTARRLSETDLSNDQVIDEIYLGALARYPKAQELDLLRSAFVGSSTATRRQAVEDVLWSVLNTKEFLYNQ